MCDLLLFTVVIVAVQWVFRWKPCGLWLSCALSVVVLVVLGWVHKEMSTYADAAYVFAWSVACCTWCLVVWVTGLMLGRGVEGVVKGAWEIRRR